MSIVKLYFICGAAMALVVLWDYNKLPATARRFARRTPSSGSQFSKLTLGIRNMVVMAVVAFFLWPMVIYFELTGKGGK